MRISKIARVASATVLGLLLASFAGLGASPASAETAAPTVTFDSPPSPSLLAFQNYALRFDQPVTGLTLDDIVVSGTANCQPTYIGLVQNGKWAELDLARCGVGTLVVTLKANSVQGVSLAGPVADVSTPVLDIQQAPTTDFPTISIQTRDQVNLGDGVLFRINSSDPIGVVGGKDGIQAFGSAQCVLAGYNESDDQKSIDVSFLSCGEGSVGIVLDALTLQTANGASFGPAEPLKSDLITVKAFDTAPPTLSYNKGGPATKNLVADHITGTVWFDLNQNHVQDANEPPLPGATVVLDGETTQKTGSNGEYDFGPLATAGEHSVSVTLPEHVGVIADSEGAADGVARVTLDVGAGASTWFGVVGDSFMSSTFSDAQGNGVTEPVVVAWAGLDGVSGTDDDVYFTANAGSDGSYLLKNVPAGDYRVLMSGKDALTGDFTLAPVMYDLATATSMQRDIHVKYKDLAYTGGSPFDGGLLVFGLAALAAGGLLLRRSKRA